MKTYHVAQNGQSIGPISEDSLKADLANGRLKHEDLCWCEGMADWQTIGSVLGDQPPALPSATPQATPTLDKPSNNLLGAILVTLFCCLPFGIVSIVYAAQVDGKHSNADAAGANDAARKSRLWMWWGLGVGLFFIIIPTLASILFPAIAAGIEAANEAQATQ